MNELPFDVWRELMKKHDLNIWDYLNLPDEIPDVAKITFLIALKAVRKRK